MQTHYPLNPTTGVEDQTQLPWTNGVPSTGTEGSYPPFALCTEPMAEIVNAITLGGLVGSSSDLSQLTRVIRGGQLDFSTDFGTADALIAHVGLAHTAIKAGLPFAILKSNVPNATPTPTLTITDSQGNNGLTGTIVKANGSPVAIGDLQANILIMARAIAPGKFALVSLLTTSDILALIFANAIRILPVGATFYVSPNGNDASDGLTAATALATITAAGRKAAALYVPGGSVAIQLTGYTGTPVTFAAPTLPSMSTPLTIVGDVNNPNHYVISGATGVIGVSGLNVNLVGLQLYNQGNTYNTLSVSAGTVTLNGVYFNGVGGNNFSHIALSSGGVLNINGNIQFQCNAQAPITVSGGVLTAGSAPGTVISTNTALTFAYIVRVTKLGSVNIAPSTVTWSGSFSGQKYLVDENAVLDCAGQASTFIPGSTAGATALGGIAN